VGPGREPERTCVGCRRRDARSGLLRVVRTSDLVARFDPGGAAAGRGAYVHPDVACVEVALGRGSVARALGVGVGPEEARKLRRFVEGMQGNA
jgi:uncharacterized protein